MNELETIIQNIKNIDKDWHVEPYALQYMPDSLTWTKDVLIEKIKKDYTKRNSFKRKNLKK